MIAALNAIGSVASQTVGGQNITTNGAATAPVDFGSVMAQVTQDAVGKLKSAEAMSISGLQGHASVQQVVETVMDAQSSLQTALAVRDKVVSAYQELSRMAI
ncbi:MAG: flagellar hook-basal body complex protein FliE [Beijerinckiaceae bacterium]